jgi:hypothetical protein
MIGGHTFDALAGRAAHYCNVPVADATTEAADSAQRERPRGCCETSRSNAKRVNEKSDQPHALLRIPESKEPRIPTRRARRQRRRLIRNVMRNDVVESRRFAPFWGFGDANWKLRLK